MILKKKESPSIVKGVMTAYLILLLHLSLIAGVGLLVIFFSGVVNYMAWIFFAGAKT